MSTAVTRQPEREQLGPAAIGIRQLVGMGRRVVSDLTRLNVVLARTLLIPERQRRCRAAIKWPISPVPRLPQPSRGDQDGLEVHDERAAVIVDGRADGFEQEVSDRWFEGGVVAP